tara:strand:+ start:640 stop:840 length:201 start_codon:yes stop_codon:yes gene_type:complete
MQVGDLVKLKGAWVRTNSWMKDTEIDDSPKEYGIIIAISDIGCHKVLWYDGLRGGGFWEDELEMVQ